MSVALGVLTAFALLAWCALVGRALLQLASALPRREERRWVPSIVAGLVAGHLVLGLLDVTGLAWSRPALLLAGGAILVLLRRPLTDSLVGARRSAEIETGQGNRDSGGVDVTDGIGALAVLACTLSCLALRSPFSDFVYHWGLKAHRFFLVQGTDYAFLARPENVYLHPDYPNLLPQTFAVTSLLAGRFEPAALMVFTPIFLLLILQVARVALRRSGLRSRARQLVFAGLACALGAFCLGYFQGGSADVPFALAVLLAATALVGPADRAKAAQLGIAAAFAAALKFEGLPFAAIAIGLFLARTGFRRAPWSRATASWVALLLPTFAVTVAWAVPVLALDLLRSAPGGLDLSQAGAVARSVWRQSLLEEWLGLPLLLISAPILVFVSKRARWLGLLVTGQAAFYLWVYLCAGDDAAFLVLTTWPRLALHLLPATVVGVAVALGAPESDAAAVTESPTPALGVG